jgi:cyclophilin family peptidyl-prolyl cis-trans isomerase
MGSDKRERQKENRRYRLEAEAAAWRRQQRNRRLLWLGIAAFVVALVIVVVNVFGEDDEPEEASPSTSTTLPGSTSTTAPRELYGTGACPPDEGVDEPVLTFDDKPELCIDPAKKYTAVFDTTEGEIRVELDTTNTPATANNFVVLSRYGYYDETKIFRTDTSIEIIQGGSPHTNSANDEGPGYNILDEGSGFTYEPGQLVMARSAGPDSASAQFFFVVGEAASGLDAQGTYVVFGNVVEGQDVLDAILALHEEDPASGLGGAPSRDVVINSITIIEEEGDGDTTTTSADGTTTSTVGGDATTTSAPADTTTSTAEAPTTTG